MKIGDPYRIKKPKEGILERTSFSYSSFNQIRSGTLKLLITGKYLWLSSELSIPLGSITSVNLDNKDRDIIITYYNVIKDQDFAIGIFCPSLIGASKKKNNELLIKLSEYVANSEPLEELLTDKENGFVIGCEVSGDANATHTICGIYYCFGIYPLLGAYGWQPRERYLSKKYAIRECMKSNFITSLVGYWGIPGIVMAPVKMWSNIKSLHDKHGISKKESIKLFVISNTVPVVIIALITKLALTT